MDSDNGRMFVLFPLKGCLVGTIDDFQLLFNSTGTQLPAATRVQGNNSTKNLENLSRLFRQLRPHILHTMTKETKVTHQISPSRSDLRGQTQPDPLRETREKAVARVDQETVCGGSCKVVEEGGVERVRPLEVKCSTEQHLAVRGRKDENAHKTSHTLDHKATPSGNLDKLSWLTSHERKGFGDIRTSHSTLSSSPATSSWESFSKPVKLSERGKEERGEERGKEERGEEERGKEEKGKGEKGREEKGREEKGREEKGREEKGGKERGGVVQEGKGPPKASIDMKLSESTLRPVPSHYDTLLKNLTEKRSAQNARVVCHFNPCV